MKVITRKVFSLCEDFNPEEGFQAADSVYEKLPDCCKYRDPASMHMDHGKHNKNR